MARGARKRSASGICHVMMRGNERKNIFLDEEDKKYFLYALQKVKANEAYELLAYCLMDNHVHVLLREKTDSLERTMKRIGIIYSFYFNKKYQRTGHLFQDRYRSEAVEEDAYVLAAVRYIHNNPVKSGITKTPQDYPWSSYRQYINKSVSFPKLADVTFLLSMLSDKPDKAIREFINFSQTLADDNFIDCKKKMIYQLLRRKKQA